MAISIPLELLPPPLTTYELLKTVELPLLAVKFPPFAIVKLAPVTFKVPLTVILAALAATFTVTTTNALMKTDSAAVGVVADPATPFTVVAQILPFQFPEVTANF